MRKRQKLFTYVEVDDRTPIQKLPIKDQLRVLIKRASHDDANELKAEDASTIYLLQLKADLLEFIQRSTDPIRKGKHSSVYMSISSKFEPVLDEVLYSAAIKSFYTVKVEYPRVDFDIPYTIGVRLEVMSH